MKKKSFWTILIKHFYGISGELDEYREQHVNRLGNRLFLLVWWYIFIQTFIAFFYIKLSSIRGLGTFRNELLCLYFLSFRFMFWVKLMVFIFLNVVTMTMKNLSKKWQNVPESKQSSMVLLCTLFLLSWTISKTAGTFGEYFFTHITF